jgi:hypothetical protein
MNTTNRDGVSVPLALPAGDKLTGNPISDGFDARWRAGSPAKPPPADFSNNRTDIPPAKAPPLPGPAPSTEPYYVPNQLSPGEASRAIEQLRAGGFSEERLKAELGDDYTAPSQARGPDGQFSSAAPPDYDFSWQDIPAARGTANLAAVHKDLSASFAAMRIPPEAAASLCKSMFEARSTWLNLPNDAARALHAKSEQYQLEQVAPGATDKAKAVIAAARAANLQWAEGLESQGVFSSRFVLAALARFAR